MNFLFYRTITGRRFDLTKLTDKERTILEMILNKYQTKPEWTAFAYWWTEEFNRSGLGDDSPLYRIFQDLEARLGIAQGKVALPDLRDCLADLIEEKYGSRYRFCKETGLDQGYLSRVLSGRTGLSLVALEKLLREFDGVLVVRREQDLRADADPNEATRLLASVGPAQEHLGAVS